VKTKFTWQITLSAAFLIFIFWIGIVSGIGSFKTIAKELINSDKHGWPFFRQVIKERKTLDSMYITLAKYNKRMFFVDFNGLMARYLGQKIVNNVVKLNNGYLNDIVGKEELSKYVVPIKNLKAYLDGQGVAFLYVNAPYKLCEYDQELPTGVKNFANENAIPFLTGLQSCGIDVLDLHKELHDDGLDHYDSFYKTDHHWTHETALWANRKILQYLKNRGLFEIKDDTYLYLENYTTETHPGYSGSFSDRTGRFYAGLDNISVILPKPGPNNPLNDIPEKVYLDRRFLDIDPYNHLYPTGQLKINNAPINKEVVLLADSFANSLHFFMSLFVRDVHFTAYLYNTDSSIHQYIANFNPDIVILLHTSPSTIRAYLDRLAEEFYIP
jgi:hypothetical protein